MQYHELRSMVIFLQMQHVSVFIDLKIFLFYSGRMGNSSHREHVYSTPIENSKKPGFSSVYRRTETLDQLIVSKDPNILTIQSFLESTFLKKYPQHHCLGKIVQNEKGNKTIDCWAYKQVFEKAHCLGSAFESEKLWSFAEDTSMTNGKQMKFIGIFAKNSREWVLADLGCALFGITSIPLYETLGIENLSYCLNQTNMRSCVVSEASAEILYKLDNIGSLKTLILTDRVPLESTQKFQKKFQIKFLDDLMEIGAKNKLDFHEVPVSPQDIYTFSYTSGTTGPPKGAMLKNENFICLINSIENSDVKLNQSDSYLSFLPLPHVMERVIYFLNFAAGSKIVLFSGDITKIKEDAQLVKPTIFAAVPRLYNKMYEGLKIKFDDSAGCSRFLLDKGLNTKRQNLLDNGQTNHGLYDSLVFSKAQEAFGGRIRIMVSGSAPLKPEVQEFLKIVFSSKFYEVYGQTENTGAAFLNRALEATSGHVGGVVCGLEFKLCDLIDMNYTANDRNEHNESTPRGEIWLRGPQVFAGYYKDPEKTKQALTEDGWLRTGDVGMILPHNNALKIIDRKKNIFKLQQGEYVASEKVQAVCLQHPLAAQVFIYGDSTQNFAVLVMSSDPERLTKFAKANGVNEPDYESICRNKNLRTALCKQIDALGKKNGLVSFQLPKNIYIEPKTFVEMSVLTNTLKLQRFNAKKVYAGAIKDMYAEGMLSLK